LLILRITLLHFFEKSVFPGALTTSVDIQDVNSLVKVHFMLKGKQYIILPHGLIVTNAIESTKIVPVLTKVCYAAVSRLKGVMKKPYKHC